MSERRLIVLEDAQALYVRAAEEIVHLSGEAICTHGQFNLCLAGGGTPAETYRLMASRFLLSVDWKEVHFFWGDERCVPPTDRASNFAMVERTMLSQLALKPAQVHRIRGEDDPDAAAQAYEDDLRQHFRIERGEFPRFDLILLGLGDNAHIASLFPGHPALHERERPAVAVEVDAAQRWRVTITAPVINHAARVMLIVGGEDKAQAVKNVLEGARDPERFPAQIVEPPEGEVMWLMDKAAAGLLSGRY